MYADLLEANTEARAHCGRDRLEIIEWEGQWHGEYTNHAKFAVFDHREALVGSYNLDPRSANLNSETVLAIRSPEAARQLENQVLTYDLPRYSQWVSWEQALEYKHPKSKKDQDKLKAALLLLREL
jgi:phosphatidylserine/phosphatidylglycerophosphate/cardiolipin synthase-like enzyme